MLLRACAARVSDLLSAQCTGVRTISINTLVLIQALITCTIHPVKVPRRRSDVVTFTAASISHLSPQKFFCSDLRGGGGGGGSSSRGIVKRRCGESRGLAALRRTQEPAVHSRPHAEDHSHGDPEGSRPASREQGQNWNQRSSRKLMCVGVASTSQQ